MKAMSRHVACLSPLVTPAIAILLAGGTLSPLVASPLAADRAAVSDHVAARVQVADKRIVIRGGCPYNLDKICYRSPSGKLYNCRCQS